MILILLIILAFIALLYIEVKRFILSKRFQHIPEIMGTTILGKSYALRPDQVNDYKLFFEKICCAKITKTFLIHKVTFFVSDPDVVQMILSGNNFSDRPFVFRFFRCPFGVMSAQYETWKPLRKALNPAFSNRLSISFVPIFTKHYKSLCFEIQQFEQKPFDLYPLIIKCLSNIILETNFGVKDPNEIDFDLHSFEKCIDNVAQRIANPLLYPNFVYSISNLAQEDEKLTKSIFNSFRKIIQKRREFHQSEDKNESRLFIDELIRYNDEINFKTDDLLIQNMFTIFMAGYETSGLTVLYTILLLAMHPEIDKRVREELGQFYTKGQELNIKVLKNLTYLEKVIKESIRLLPPAPTSARQNLQPTYLDKVGFIEKGTTFVISYYNLHRWKDIWGKDANEFNPEHFSEENTSKRHAYAFLPFGAGPKICLAYQYAMINVKIGLILLLSEFKFTTKLKLNEMNFKYCPSLKVTNECFVIAQSQGQ